MSEVSTIPLGSLLVAGVIILTTIVIGVIIIQVGGKREEALRRRVRAIATGTGVLTSDENRDPSLAKRRSIQNKLKEVENKREKRRGYKLRAELIQAGMEIKPYQFIIVSFIIGGIVTGLYFAFSLPRLGLLPVALASTFGLPKMYLRIRVNKRINAFTKLFADAIDIIVRGVRSGLPVSECLNIIGREMPDPVGEEFRLISEGSRLGMTLNDCLERSTERTPTAELRFFAIVLAIQQQTGGNLAETLAKLSEVLRGRKRMRDKVQAMSSEAKSSAGIIGSLPIIVGTLLSLVAPKYVGVLFTTDTGHFLIAGGLVWMGLGILVMRQMIHFDM
jgi:tight adherence protein B